MKTPEEIIKEKYPFYDENYTNKDVELNGKQVTELMIRYADQFKQVKVEPKVKPACETDKTQCKFCTRETTADDFGFGKDRVCKSCLEKALANELRNMEQ